MTRVEANAKLMNHFRKEALKNPQGTFEEIVTWHLGTIGSILSDISASLAVIADSMSGSEIPTREESEDKEQR